MKLIRLIGLKGTLTKPLRDLIHQFDCSVGTDLAVSACCLAPAGPSGLWPGVGGPGRGLQTCLAGPAWHPGRPYRLAPSARQPSRPGGEFTPPFSN